MGVFAEAARHGPGPFVHCSAGAADDTAAWGQGLDGRLQRVAHARRPALLADRRSPVGARKRRAPPARRRGELPGVAGRDPGGATLRPLRELHPLRRRRGAALRRRVPGEGARRSAGPRRLRLVRLPGQGLRPALAPPARRRGGRPVLQPAAPGPAAGVDRARPPKVPRGRRPRWPSSPGSAWGRSGRAHPSAASPRGATRVSRFAVPRWPKCRTRSPTAGRPPGRLCLPTRSPLAGLAEEGDLDLRIVASTPGTAGLYRLDPLVASPRPPHALADRRLLRRHVHLRAGPAGRGAGRRRREAARSRRRQRHPLHAVRLPRRVSGPAGGGHPRLRVERSHGPRQDRGRRRALGARGLDEPQPRELDGEPRAGRGGRERGLRSRDGGAQYS